MKNRLAFLLVIAFLLGVIFLLGCAVSNNPFTSNRIDTNVKSGYGVLSVQMPSGRSWTVNEYSVTATRAGEDPVSTTTTNNSVSLTLKIGTWDIHVDGKDEGGNVIYQGTASANVTETGTSVAIGLLKRAGNLQLFINSLPGYNITSGNPGFIEKIIVTASKTGFADVQREVNNFDSAMFFSLLADGDWTISVEAQAKDINPIDYTPLSTYITYLSGSFTEHITAGQLTTITDTLPTQNKVSPVIFGIQSGTYSSTISLSLSCETTGATIYYSIDGSNPTIPYSSPISITAADCSGGPITVKTKASKSGVTSDSIIGVRTYDVDTQVTSLPQFDKNSGTYSSDISVAITSPDGGTIYYTTNGSTPTTSSSVYSSPISVSGDGTTMTIKAMAIASGMTQSDTASGTYLIEYPQVVTPSISPSSGTYDSNELFTIICGTPGSTIYYTTDNSDPTVISNPNRLTYSQGFTLADGSYTIKAYAVASGYSNSLVTSQTYTISSDINNTITFTQADILIEGPDWNEYDLTASEIKWIGLQVDDTSASYVFEWQSDFSGLIQLFQNDMVTEVSLTGSGNLKQATLEAGTYFVKVNPQYNYTAFQLRFQQGSITTDPSLAVSTNSLDYGTLNVNNTSNQTVTVSNSGQGSLDWAITDDKSWITASPTSGTVSTGSDSVSITVNTTGLTAGSYNGTVTVSSNTTNVQNSPQTITVSVIVSDNSLGSNHPSSGAYSPVDESNWGSASYQLGSHYLNGANSDLTFAVYAKHATKVLLEIYSTKTGSNAQYDYWMVKGSDNIWRAKLTTVPDKIYYGFRVWGPNWPYNSSWSRGNSSTGFVTDVDSSGNRYNPNKVLYDPYGKEMSHDKDTPEMAAAGETGAMYGTGGVSDATPHGYTGPCTSNVEIDRRNVDTGKWAPKSIALVDDGVGFGTKPNIAQKDAIIYEAHVRGLTKDSSSTSLSSILSGFSGFADVVDVPAEYRGTYKGAGYMAKYLKDLGFTTIELLPIHETANDSIDTDPNSGSDDNYWGYMTYSFFAPDRRYSYDKSSGGPTKEFKEMIQAFHNEGLEVYLDVVYNHTGEGGVWDAKYYPSYPTLNPNYTTKCKEITSFAGFDNSEYYALVDGQADEYWVSTGVGNNFNSTKGVVKQLILDSLTYWLDSMGVDGFRFDLATVLGRDSAPNYDYNTNAQLLTDIASLGNSKNAEMIAEAWDTQWPGGYQVSNFPSGWGEWNGLFRDVVRKFIKGEGHKVTNYPSLSTVFNGSYDLEERNPGSGNDHTGFYDNGGPQKSVNFVDAHDGFTLMDLVSYNDKQNSDSAPVWPFGPSDGGSGDDAWDSGGDKTVRRQQLKNIWTFLMFARGVPMVVWGDEFGRTQNGNSNPYNIDSICTYNNYNMINTDSPNAVSTGFAGQPYHNNFGADTNADNKNALFSFVKYVVSLRNNHVALRQSDYNMTIDYRKEDGTSLLQDDNKCIWIRMDGSSVGDDDFLLLINSYSSLVNYTVPAASTGKKWVRIIDTASWAEANDNYWNASSGATITTSYGVNPYAIVVLEEVNQ